MDSRNSGRSPRGSQHRLRPDPKTAKALTDGKPSPLAEGVFRWPPLISGTLIRRYKRFMADVRLSSGVQVTAHCPNSGKMLACCEPGRPVYLSRADNPKRKLRYTWELIKMPTSLVGVNTLNCNRMVKAAVCAGAVRKLSGYDSIRTEVAYGNNSRIDMLLEKGSERCFVEVKNCTLVENGTACFPDAVTQRGLKHLVELEQMVSQGHRAVMFYLVQRMDARRFRPAEHIDPAYARQLRKAHASGLEILVYDVVLNLEQMRLNHRLDYTLEP